MHSVFARVRSRSNDHTRADGKESYAPSYYGCVTSSVVNVAR